MWNLPQNEFCHKIRLFRIQHSEYPTNLPLLYQVVFPIQDSLLKFRNLTV